MTNSSPKLVSIILPTYNGEKYISDSISSCLGQTYINIELIVVNDCSIDGTSTIIGEWAKKDERIEVVNNSTNMKLPKSLNIGFEQAKGEYISWTSDDNFYAPQAIQALSEILDNNPKVDIAYSSYQFVDENGQLIGKFGGVPENLIFKCVVGACFLYRRKVHEELGGYDVNKFRMEDMDYWLRAASKFKFYYLNRSDLYCYRKHNESLTAEIHSSPGLLSEYKINYVASFDCFLNGTLEAGFTEKELETHIKLFFNQGIHNSGSYRLGEEVNTVISYLDKLAFLNWDRVFFDAEEIKSVILEKREEIVNSVISNLVFENKILSKQNPKLSEQLARNVSWYYKEYEVLPGWYKKIGHILKCLQGNKSWKELIGRER
ncbi:glycosyltransferase family A protein [Nibribacter koreensis]|uniref:Glycosyltransferase 2-like domain-containing protein n=1 Tax=Nibribacter koreensis TaxID=1084519 RepID=A0ABP8F4Y4_9BACT